MSPVSPKLDVAFLQKSIEKILSAKDPSFTLLDSRDYSPTHHLIKYQLYDFTPIFLAVEIDYEPPSWEVTSTLVLARNTEYQLADRHTLFLADGTTFYDQVQMLEYHLDIHSDIIKLLRKDFK